MGDILELSERRLMEPQYVFEVSVDGKPRGIAMASAVGGMSIPVCFSGFLTPETGDLLFDVLSGVSAEYLHEWKQKGKKSEVGIDNCLIYINRETARVHINIPLVAMLMSKRAISKGEAVTREDIADLREFTFQGVKEEVDCGVVFIFTIGWRRYLYFDYTPLLPESERAAITKGLPQTPIHNIAPLLYSRALFPDIFNNSDEVLKKAWELGWFPFVRLLGSRYDTLLHALANGFPIEESEEKVAETFNDPLLDDMLDSWMRKDIFKPSEEFLREGIRYYLRGEYIASISILYPRIEGLMRFLFMGEKDKPTQGRLVDKLVEIANEKNPGTCLFNVGDFGNFLKEFYFANFDLESGEVNLSRHSLSHGVVGADQINKKRALQAILILDQMFFYV